MLLSEISTKGSIHFEHVEGQKRNDIKNVFLFHKTWSQSFKIGSVNLPKMGKISRGEILKMGRLRLKRKLYLWKKKIIQEGELGNWLRRNRSRSLGWIWATNLLGPREKLLLPPWSQVTDLLNYKWSK